MATISNKTARDWMKNNVVLFILIGVFVLFVIISGGKFAAQASLINIIRVSVPPLMIGTVATLLMITGNIDLSVGGIMGFCACVFALLMQNQMHFYLGLIIVAALGLLLGLVNGLIVTKLSITPVISTLAMASLFIGLAKILVPDRYDIIKGNMPENMNFFSRGKFFLDLPPSVFLR